MPDPDRDLIEQAHQIRTLQEHPGWHYLAAFTADAERKKLDYLIRGAKTLDEHRNAAGFIEGIRYVLNAADTLQRQIER